MKTKLILTAIAASILFPLSAFSVDTLKQQYVNVRFVTVNHYTNKLHVDMKDVSAVMEDIAGTQKAIEERSVNYNRWIILKNGFQIGCEMALPSCEAVAKWQAYRDFLHAHPEFLNVP